jgi:serine/threonine protein phosphatase 1
MAKMRLIGIGDIHGHRDKLDDLLEQVQPAGEDLLVFLGDYIDRGPDSPGVLERLISLHQELPKTIFLRGNHEQMLLDCLFYKRCSDRSKNPGSPLAVLLKGWTPLAKQTANIIFDGNPLIHKQNFLNNGGIATIEQYSGWGSIPVTHVEFLMATRLTYRIEPFLFVHAGAMPDVEAEEQDPWVLLWSRFSPPGQNGEIHVVGHTPVRDGHPHFEAGRYNLDTAAAYGGPLSAVEVRTGQLWQA